MALVTFSPLVNNIRGRVGDIVYSVWRGIPYIRRHVPHNTSNTPAQASQRQSFAQAVHAWQTLDSKQQRCWSQAAMHLNMSGYNLFISRYLIEKTAAMPDKNDHLPAVPIPATDISHSYPLRFLSTKRPLRLDTGQIPVPGT